jgi:hypothetical protein
MRKLLLILFCSILPFGGIHGQADLQELVSSSGGEFSSPDYMVSWSVGECITETFTTNDYILSQGFHQGTYQITSIEKTDDLSINVTVYPNPAIDRLKIRVSDKEIPNSIEAQLYDTKGALLLTRKLLKNEEEIQLAQFQGQCFFLKLYSENKMLQSFKILKTF